MKHQRTTIDWFVLLNFFWFENYDKTMKKTQSLIELFAGCYFLKSSENCNNKLLIAELDCMPQRWWPTVGQLHKLLTYGGPAVLENITVSSPAVEVVQAKGLFQMQLTTHMHNLRRQWRTQHLLIRRLWHILALFRNSGIHCPVCSLTDAYSRYDVNVRKLL